MMHVDNKRMLSLRQPWVDRTNVWSWSAVLVSMLVCFLVGWIHIQEKRTVHHFLANLENIRQARIELNRGFLQFSLGDAPEAPFDPASGLALLDQAIASFGSTLETVTTLDVGAVAKFRNSVAEFRQRLAEWRENGAERRSHHMVTLRIAFSALERQADLLDREAHFQLQVASERLDRRFISVSVGAAFALAVFCVLVFHAGCTKDHSEAAAWASAERFHEAMEVTEDGVWEWNIPCDTLYQSPGCLRMLGYFAEARDANRQVFFDLVHPEDAGRVEAAIQCCVKNECPVFEMEFRVKANDGSWRWLFGRGKITHRDAQGNALRMLGTSVDITERKKSDAEREMLREQLMQAQKMESIGRLAGGVAHDFNNMLQGILGFGELLELDTAERPELQELATEICKTVKRAQNLTRQLLTFSREQPFHPVLVNLHEQLLVIQKMLQRIVSEVKIAVSPAAGLLPVSVDVGQFEQVVLNLVVNARDAITDIAHGVITISAENITLDAEACAGHVTWRPGTFVRLSVCDNGVGIAPELCEKIFEPFYTTKQQEHGTGLGLSVVYGIMKQHGGWVDVDGNVGAGAAFHLYFPVGAAKPLDGTEGHLQCLSEADLRGHSETILVVEDEEVVLKMVEKVFSVCGYQVLCATTVADGWTLFERHHLRVGVLFSDVILPDGNGLDLADRIRKIRPTLPVVLSSGYTRDVLKGRLLEDTRYLFLEKPYTRIEALAVLHEALHRADHEQG